MNGLRLLEEREVFGKKKIFLDSKKKLMIKKYFKKM